jgi:L-asparagine oxygenase
MTREPICELKPDHELDAAEKQALHEALSSPTANPYRHYGAFRYQVNRLIEERRIPQVLIDLFRRYAAADHEENPFVFVRNLPIDGDVPPFDNERPVHSKYELKKTFVAEACLAMIADLTQQTPVGYLNVNDGDVFQDIYPAAHMRNTQSQKALGPIYFHKDLANHYVRPDHVNMLSMRCSRENEIVTTFVRNVDVIRELTPDEIDELRKVQFYTPFDDLTVQGKRHDVGRADNHPILSGHCDLRFFENRTVGTDERSNALVARVVAALHKVKKRVQMLPGDFIGVENNTSLHGKEVGEMRAPEEAWRRWTIKTVNVRSVEPHRPHLVPGSDYLIAG